MIRSPAVLLIWLLCPLAAVLVGYMLATPTDLTSLGAVGLGLLLLLTPILLRWHQELLIISWNSFFIVFFLPGQPALGITLAAASVFISVLTRTLRREKAFIRVPSLTYPLILLTVVVVTTAMLTGGIGLRVLGSSNFGGKRYIMLLGSILAYFAFTAAPIRGDRVRLMAALFFLSGISAAMSDVIYALGPSFYFLFVLCSANIASMQALSAENLVRFSGLAWGSLAFCHYWLMRYGVRGLFDLIRPYRLLVFLAAVGLGLMGGFRSTLVLLVLLFAVQFYIEGLYRTRFLPIFLVFGLLVGGFTIVFIDRMPLAVQRSLSFLPIDVDPMAKHDAMNSLDWRWQIWKIVLPEVPRYLFLGKGYSFSGTDLYLTQEAISRGLYGAYEDMIISGNYHHGILTTVIPFGLFGLFAFLWFCWSSVKVLIANHRYGNPEYQSINSFLLTFFVVRLIFFLALYGQLELDLAIFTGTIGLSVAINNGVAAPATAPVEAPALAPSLPPVLGLGLQNRRT